MQKSRWPVRVGGLVAGVCAAVALYAASAPRPSSAPAATATKPVSVLTGAQVIQILDETVDWYRALGTQQQNATQPSDLLILFANRQTADKVVSLAFDMARANAELLSSEASAAVATDHDTASVSLEQKQAQLDSERQGIQQEMATDKQQLATTGKGRQDAEAKISELQGELAMIDARRNMLDTMTEFIHGSDPKAANANALKSQIDAIAATVPSAGVSITAGAATTTATATATSSAAAPAATSTAATPLGTTASTAPSRYGLWDLAVGVSRAHAKLSTIDDITERTKALATTFHKISDAPRAQLQAFSTQGDGLAAQADHADGATLKGLRDQFDTLAWLVQQTSAILLPLGKEQVLLERYEHNLTNWRVSAEKQYHEAWTALGVRLGIVGGILIVIFVLGEVWRSAVFRYVHEPHRRYQMLLVRTIVVWAIVAVVLGLSFVTEISTFATFAGLLSAGLAVAMQSVLVSVVGYFFLIGKFGIRVGDRIQIGTVVGEVLDIGLVRLHLMELTQTGPLGSTGRVVAFPNLIVFQTTGGLFKQTSGTDVAWHETTLPLPSAADYAALKQKLLAAIAPIVSKYADPKAGADSAPQVNMRLNAGKMEAVIRYPLNYKHALETDEQVAQAVLQVLA